MLPSGKKSSVYHVGRFVCVSHLLPVLLWIGMLNTAGQSDLVKFRHLTSADGLSQNWITSIFQDSRGYMWFGTVNNGLNKYNGSDFTNYKSEPSNLYTISHNTINFIFEDRQERLWIGTNSGLNLYNRQLDRFEVVAQLWDTYLTAMIELNDGRFYLINDYDIRLYDPDSDSIAFIYNNGVSLNYEFFNPAYLRLSEQNILLGTAEGLMLLNQNNQQFLWLQSATHPVLNKSSVLSILQDQEGRVWVGTERSGLFCIRIMENLEIDVLEYFPSLPGADESSPSAAILSLAEVGNSLWIVIENVGIEILEMNENVDRISHKQSLRSDLVNNYSLSDNAVHSIYHDREGTIWVGTYSRGVDYYNPDMYKFTHHRRNLTPGTSINNDHVNVILDETDKLWIGTEGGLDCFDRLKGSWTYYTHDPNNSRSIGSNAVWDILRDSRGKLWVATWAGGLNLLHEETGTFTRFMQDDNRPTSISNNNVFGIIEDRYGMLWVATMGGGVNTFDPTTGSFVAYMRSDTAGSLSNNWVKAVLESHDGEIWLGTSGGIHVFNRNNQEFRVFLNDSASPGSISNDHAIVLFEDSRNQIWIGTENGLNLYLDDRNEFRYYGKKSGFANNVIKGILEDSDGNLWISTNEGISKFINGIHAPDNPVIINYDKNDGLQGEEFTSRSAYRAPDGKMYFGGIFGYNTFYPDSIRRDSRKPRVVLTDLQIFNKPVEIGENSILREHISLTKEIRLSHEESVFSISYSALDYLTPDNNVFAYRLTGFSDEWSIVGNRKEATYTNLDPGTYVFQVNVRDDEGQWDEGYASLTIVIVPPWWETILFRFLAALFILTLGTGFYFYRVSNLRRQKQNLEEKVVLRTREIREKNYKLEEQTRKLNDYNQMLEERQEQIEKQNTLLREQTQILNMNNKLLNERQAKIEEQSEELKVQAEALQQSNEKLVELNASKDKFFSIVAHDLKNPFNSIIGLTELLGERFGTWPEEKSRMIISSLLDASQNAYNLLENMLTWSRSQRNALPFEPKEFELKEVLQMTLNLTREMARKKEISITAAVNPTGLKVVADKNMLYTVLRNLVTNAIKYSMKGGKVKIQAENTGGTIQLSVEDQGIGMSPETRESLFKIGTYHSLAGTDNEQGTGLGLILTKEFIDKHHGTLSVESEIDKGSRFIISLPLKQS